MSNNSLSVLPWPWLLQEKRGGLFHSSAAVGDESVRPPSRQKYWVLVRGQHIEPTSAQNYHFCICSPFKDFLSKTLSELGVIKSMFSVLQTITGSRWRIWRSSNAPLCPPTAAEEGKTNLTQHLIWKRYDAGRFIQAPVTWLQSFLVLLL